MTTTEQEPFYLQWHITNKCNLRCKHCYQKDYSGKELTLKELKKFYIHFLSFCAVQGKKPEIALTGGEPLKRQDIFELIKFMKETEPSLRLSLFSNGTMLTKQHIKKLENLIENIQISLEGSTKEINDVIRGQGTFEKIMKASKSISNSKTNLHFQAVLMKNNLRDIENIIDLAERSKANAIVFSRLVPQGSGKKIFEKQMLSKQELKKAFKTINKRATELKQKNSKLSINRYRTLWAILSNKRHQLGGMCSAGICSIDVLHNGDILPCRRLPIKIGNVKKDSLFKVWNSNPLLKKLRNPHNLKGCGKCKHLNKCRGCRAIAYATEKNLYNKDPQCFMKLN